MSKRLRCFIIGQLIFSCLFLLGWTYTLKTNTPAGSDDPTEADDRMREAKAAWQERLNIDHYFYPSTSSTYDAADSGKHRFITFREPNDLTSMAADESSLFSKDVSSVTELHWIDESDNVLQLTSGGTINIVSADLLGTLANATYLTAVDAAGTGTVDLIQADANDVAVVPDNSQTATNAAPTSTTGIANKKYVDDNKRAYIKLVDSKATTTDGGTFTQAGWRKRTVTEETDTGANCSVSSSVIVLGAGTYECLISCPASKVSGHQARLRNTTAGTTILEGTAAHATASHAGSSRSFIVGRFTIAASQNVEIQHRCVSTNADTGFGVASDTGGAEIYTIAEFWKI